ncbi:MAG: PilZ domain-containing protein [Hyphomicrobium sp.]|nr:PilZ domain-containing protein [Hyphomicrobium sp.]
MSKARKPWPHRSADVEDILEQPEPAPNPSSSPKERRKHERQSATQHVAVHYKYGREICDLVDLSPTGARLKIANGTIPNIGDAVAITLLDGTTIKGRVSWLGQNNVGVALGSEIGDVEALLTFDDMGEAYYGAALRLQQKSRAL